MFFDIVGERKRALTMQCRIYRNLVGLLLSLSSSLQIKQACTCVMYANVGVLRTICSGQFSAQKRNPAEVAGRWRAEFRFGIGLPLLFFHLCLMKA
jgi:hypothetical protein